MATVPLDPLRKVCETEVLESLEFRLCIVKVGGREKEEENWDGVRGVCIVCSQ